MTVGERAGAGFRLADADLDGYVLLDFYAFDAWLEEDEPIHGHPRDPFSRVDVRLTSRPVRIELGGEVLAESSRARLLFETLVPTRFYLPREDVRVPLTAEREDAPIARTRARRRTGRRARTRTSRGATRRRCRTCR